MTSLPADCGADAARKTDGRTEQLVSVSGRVTAEQLGAQFSQSIRTGEDLEGDFMRREVHYIDEHRDENQAKINDEAKKKKKIV